MSKKLVSKKRIRELEQRVKRLEEEKEVLKVAIDIAGKVLDTDIRKKYLSLLSNTTIQGQQAHRGDKGNYSWQQSSQCLGISPSVLLQTLQGSSSGAIRGTRSAVHGSIRAEVDAQNGWQETVSPATTALQQKPICFGRDKLFRLMSVNGLLIKPKKDLYPDNHEQALVEEIPQPDKRKGSHCSRTDITYIKTQEGNCYLNKVTDAYSRKIMGYAIADTMNTDAMIPAYRMSLKKRIHKSRQLIHHTDRGYNIAAMTICNYPLKTMWTSA